MCLTDKIFLQKHVTFCEYLVFHEFKRNLYITLAISAKNRLLKCNANDNLVSYT